MERRLSSDDPRPSDGDTDLVRRPEQHLAGHDRPLPLLPLRIFLGVTFVYAGLDKLTDSTFLRATGAGSIGETMRAVRDSCAVPALVDLALKSPVGFGYAISLGELAVGIGILIGLLGRVAALGGALISLSLWLTVSWSSTPTTTATISPT